MISGHVAIDSSAHGEPATTVVAVSQAQVLAHTEGGHNVDCVWGVVWPGHSSADEPATGAQHPPDLGNASSDDFFTKRSEAACAPERCQPFHASLQDGTQVCARACAQG